MASDMLGRSLPEAWATLEEPIAGFERQEDMEWDFDRAVAEQADFSLEAAGLEEELEPEEDFAAVLADLEGTPSASSSGVTALAAESRGLADAVVLPHLAALVEGAKRRRLSVKQSVPAVAERGQATVAPAPPAAEGTAEEIS